jgi:hypothetical protein
MTLLIQRMNTEQSRCKRLVDTYRELGSAGAFGAALVQAALQRADFAAACVDEAGMRNALAQLQAFEEERPKPTAFRRVAAPSAAPAGVRPLVVPSTHPARPSGGFTRQMPMLARPGNAAVLRGWRPPAPR